ncbi:MAG: gliding motility-associated C-terminal domain-containing protein [Bacteroidota bacterium]|nr:gliding motility-associated C-terminal domain-containing protein [Bacteroidota bacterium]
MIDFIRFYKLERYYILSIVISLLCTSVYAQNPAPGCPTADAGLDTTLIASSSCVLLTANYLDVGETTSYAVAPTPYAPPYPFTGGTPLFIGVDDIWSSIIQLPFTFCFFGNTYNAIIVGANGVISFDLANAGGYCAWSFNNAIPSPTIPYPNSINGAYHDMDPSVGGDINYAVLGSYPCRTFVVNYNNVTHFQCNNITTTQQIVLYETTNVIEVYIDDKPVCNTWNLGNAVIGIQDQAGTLGYTPPNRNTSSWTASQEAWRFTPAGPSICSVNWYESGVSTPISTNDTITVCPGNNTNYIVEVIYSTCDSNQVVETDSVLVSVGCGAPQLNTTLVTPSCASGSDGSIQPSLSSGNILSISWTGPNSFTSNSPNITNLISGDYIATIMYALNCPPIIDTISLFDPAVMGASYISNDITCFGDNDGTIDLTINGGYPPYNISWNGPNSFSSNNEDINQLSGGIYSVLIADSNNCSVFYNIQVQEPAPIILNASISDLSCVSVHDGIIDVTVTGGTPFYSFLWNTGSIIPYLNSLSEGSYILTVIDNKNCIKTDTFEVLAATFYTNATPITTKCYGGTDGAIDLEITGGNYPYTYQWSSGENTQDIINIPSGFYQVSITDITNCIIDTTIFVNQPPLLNSIYSVTDVSCFGGNDGSIQLQITGGIPPYFVDWGGLDTLNVLAGTHAYQINDSNGCVYNGSVIVPEPDSLSITFNTTSVQCYGESNGAIDIMIQQGSGTPSYLYTWSGPNLFSSISEDISNISAGVYSVNILDANGCNYEYFIIVEEPTPLNQFVNFNMSDYNSYNIKCKGDHSGWISVDISGGYIPYTYLWSTGENTSQITNLYAGNYSIEITDALGCKINYGGINLIEPNDIPTGNISATTNYNGYQVSCYQASDGAIKANVSGGISPYTYDWNHGNTGDSIINLNAGYYEVYVEDNNGCLWIDSITLSAPDAIFLTVNYASDTCARGVGFGDVQSSGGVPPYRYIWTNGDTNSTVFDFVSGVYDVHVLDDNDCQVSATVSISDLTSPEADFNRYPENNKLYKQYDSPFIFSDNTKSYWQNIKIWRWDIFDSDGFLIYSTEGQDSVLTYSFNTVDTFMILMTITTEYNCIDTISYKVTVNDFNIYIPNSFTPNPDDNINNIFRPYGFGIKKVGMQIFSKWGGLVYQSTFENTLKNEINNNTLDLGWNGSFKGTSEICPIGVYTYVIDIENVFGEVMRYEGLINLIY